MCLVWSDMQTYMFAFETANLHLNLLPAHGGDQFAQIRDQWQG
jgi:hypothetical protein